MAAPLLLIAFAAAAPAPSASADPSLEDVHAFGDAKFYGSTGLLHLEEQIVGMAARPQGDGYWLVAADGGVFTYGNAQFYGSTGAIDLVEPIVDIAPTASGKGYWLVASDGGIFNFGDAEFHGSAGNIALFEPIVGMAPTANGNGYWLVATDGGIFSYGNAPFHGSAGNIALFEPIVGMAPTANGNGYWLVATDGGIFSYGNAPFHGSAGNIALFEPIVGMAPTANGNGYWLVATDGGIFSYGNAPFHGSVSGQLPTKTVVGIDTTPSGNGYWVVARDKPREPLTGEFVDAIADRPVLAVKIDNHGAARPQAGIEAADIVFEELVEGNLTRFLSLFHGTDAGLLGPIRSARTTDIDILGSLGTPIFAYSGANTGVRQAVAAADVFDASERTNGSWYYRRSGRYAPHNLFSSTTTLYTADPGLPVPPEPFDWAKPADPGPASATPASTLTVNIGEQTIGWTTTGDGRWTRTQNGATHTTETGGTITADTVLVLVVPYVESGVDARSPEAVTVGSGAAWMFIDDNVVAGSWSRGSAAQPFTLRESNGELVRLPPGKTWVELAENGVSTVVAQ